MFSCAMGLTSSQTIIACTERPLCCTSLFLLLRRSFPSPAVLEGIQHLLTKRYCSAKQGWLPLLYRKLGWTSGHYLVWLLQQTRALETLQETLRYLCCSLATDSDVLVLCQVSPHPQLALPMQGALDMEGFPDVLSLHILPWLQARNIQALAHSCTLLRTLVSLRLP